MKQFLLIMIAVAVCTSCDVFKKPILIEDVASEKVRIEGSGNPAQKYLINKDLGKRRIMLYDVTVKNVVDSNNIDYDFCVLVDVQTKKGPIECNIYSKDVKTIAKLVKGTTKIDVVGVFGRFFSTLDDYFTKVDIIRASIAIK